MVGCGDVARAGRGWRQVLLVDADVEAGLLELFLHVDLALLDEGQKVAAKPGDLGEAESVLGEVDGLAGEVGGGGVAFGGGGIAVGAEEALLELDGADRGVDLEGSVEAHIVSAGQGGEELRGPRAAVTAVGGEAVVDDEDVAGGEGDEKLLGAELEDVGVVLDAVESVAVGDLVLTEEDLVGAFEGWRDDEAAALVVEGGKKDWGGGCLLDGGERGALGGGADQAEDADGLVGCGLRGFGWGGGGRGGLEKVRGGGLLGGGVDAGDGGGDGVADRLVVLAVVSGPGLGAGLGLSLRALLGGRCCWSLDVLSRGGVPESGLERGRGERQGCERQDGSDGGVCAHSDLGGGETPEQLLV